MDEIKELIIELKNEIEDIKKDIVKLKSAISDAEYMCEQVQTDLLNTESSLDFRISSLEERIDYM